MLSRNKTQDAFQAAQVVMPHGVSSNYRYEGDNTTVIVRGEGGHIWDADDNRFIDYRLGFGPVVLGHCDPRVTSRVSEVISTQGTIFAHTHPLEAQVAERIVRMCPGVDQVRFTNSGTESTMHALRVARGHTGREKFIKIEGQYHGFHDHTMWSMTGAPLDQIGDRARPNAVPASLGIPQALGDLVLPVPYNDFEVLEQTIRAHGHELAAMIVETVYGSLGSIMPQPGYLELIRSLCDEYGIVMIIDDVKAGFRIANGGSAELFGVKPDLVTFAKALANGFPLACFGGSAEVMGSIEPGKLEHGGTYCGNLVGLAAADVTLDLLENEGVLATCAQTGQALIDGMGEVLTEAGIPHVFSGVPTMFSFFVGTEEAPTDYRSAMQTDMKTYQKISQAMYARGIEYSQSPSNFFICEAHSEADVELTLNALNEAVRGG
jgi:glutamate-1-semialdehyde 2,1-aminomutase